MFKLPRLDAVCLCINSPGGSPCSVRVNISKRIISLAKELDVTVYSFVEDVQLLADTIYL